MNVSSKRYVLKLKEILENAVKDNRIKKIIMFIGLAGILLVFMSGLFKSDGNRKEANLTGKQTQLSQDEYVSNMEKNVKNIVSKISGAGKAEVLITMESDGEIIYATEEKKNNQKAEDICDGKMTKLQKSGDTEKRYIKIKDKDGTEKALIVTEKKPKIRGVVVICEGGDNSEVEQRITSAVTTALDITTNRVFVTKSSQSTKTGHKEKLH